MSSVFANIIFVGSDHAGFALKSDLIKQFPDLPWRDLGTNSDESVDYPDYADRVVNAMKEHGIDTSVGVLLCGSGQGMAIRANRYSFIRAALCWNEEIARLSRAHNDANVLCLPSRFIEPSAACVILAEFLNTPFEGGGRHERRVKKL